MEYNRIAVNIEYIVNHACLLPLDSRIVAAWL